MVRLSCSSLCSSLSTLLVVAGWIQLAAAADVADFSYYPSGAQSCLKSAATSSKCDQSTVAKFNACVCSNGGTFIDTAAKCIGQSSSKDLTTTYTVLARNCADSNTPLNNYALDRFLAQASATTAAATVSTRTATSLVTITTSGTTRVSTALSTVVTSVAPSLLVSTITVATTNAAGQPTGVLSVVTFAPLQSVTARPSASASATAAASSGLSTGAAVGIGVGVGVGVLLILGAIAALIFLRYKKRRSAAVPATEIEKQGPQELDSFTASAPPSQAHSPYAPNAHPAAAHKGGHSPYTPSQSPYQVAAPMYDAQQQQFAPVELSGTPVTLPPQELPGSFRHPGT